MGEGVRVALGEGEEKREAVVRGCVLGDGERVWRGDLHECSVCVCVCVCVCACVKGTR